MKRMTKTLSALLALGLVALAGQAAFAAEQDFFNSLSGIQAKLKSGAKARKAAMIGREIQRREALVRTANNEGASAVSLRSPQGSVDASSPWDRVQWEYTPRFPMFPFQGWLISIDELCHVDGESFEKAGQNNTLSSCLEWEAVGDGDTRCMRYEEVPVSIPRVYAAEKCVRWEMRGLNNVCVESATVKKERQLSYDVDVYKVNGLSEEIVFTKRYDIPACR